MVFLVTGIIFRNSEQITFYHPQQKRKTLAISFMQRSTSPAKVRTVAENVLHRKNKNKRTPTKNLSG